MSGILRPCRLLLAAAVLASAVPCRADLKEEPGGIYAVEEEFSIDASSRTVWEVLTDYDNLPRFISSMESSRVVGRSPLAVEQRSTGGFLIFKREVRVLLSIDEKPFKMISFEAAPGKDFTHYSGSWTIAAAGEGARVGYRLKVKPNFSLPAWIARWVFAHQASRLIEEIRGEVSLRKGNETAD